MSTWLHVSGLIRVDGLPAISTRGYTTEHVMKLLGPMFLPYFYVLKKDQTITIPLDQARFVTEHKYQDECTLPCGSEGSLNYRVITYDTGLPWISIPFWGDLRDVQTTQDVVKWFMNCCRVLQQEFMFVRDAVMTLKRNDETPTCYVVTHETDGSLALLTYD